MDPNEQIGGLIDTLLGKTRDGRLEWASTPLSSAYNVVIPTYSITIRRIGSGILPNYTLAIMNSVGEEIDSYTANPPQGLYYSSLEEIFNRARRKAMRADETIAQIQEALAKV